MTMRGATAALVLVPALALAHGGAPPTPATLGDARVLEPGVVVPLGLTAICWLAGVIALWRDAGAGRGVRATEAASFVAGWVVLAIALASPLHPLGRAVFSAHMTQHELLMLVAAPLLVAGRPLVPFLHGLPRSWRAPLARFFRRRPLASAWDALTHPLVAWAVHALTLWAWHAPRLYTAAVAHEGVHAAQHASFLAGALLFWWSLLRRRGRWAGTGAAVLYLFTTSLHAGALGAILTFAPRPLYPGYVATAASWGLDPLRDQQLGGLIMWIPASLPYLVAALLMLARGLRDDERRVARGNAVAAVLLLALLAGCGREREERAAARTGGDPRRGRELVAGYGCPVCHTIPGVRGADGLVGPPLGGIARRVFIAGVLPNTPDAMIRWLAHPQEVDPLTAMPDMNVPEREARDMAAYLYTLE